MGGRGTTSLCVNTIELIDNVLAFGLIRVTV